MLDPTIRRRLSDIARGKSPEASPSPAPPAGVLIHPASESFPPVPPFAGLVTQNQHGECLIYNLAVDTFYTGGARLVDSFKAVCSELRCDPHRVIFLDLETTGLCGVPLFLIGSMRLTENGFHVNQLFARNYAEEKSLLWEYQHLAASYEALVTFNGTTFDVPFVRDRCARHRLQIDIPTRQIDVLTHARTRWRGKYPDCKLQTLETFVCGRHRTGDIPGRLIPGVYHDYVKSGDITPLLPVFDHNTLDLLTTLELCLELFGSGA